MGTTKDQRLQIRVDRQRKQLLARVNERLAAALERPRYFRWVR